MSEKVRIVLEARGDGGLRVWSDDVPGLVLSHSDAGRVGADIVPTLRVLCPSLFSTSPAPKDLKSPNGYTP